MTATIEASVMSLVKMQFLEGVSSNQFSMAAFRTQLFGPNEINNVKKIQSGYRVQPLETTCTDRSSRRLRHQRNKTTVGRMFPSCLPTDYNCVDLVTAQNCSDFGI
jgi:hypothetical protein